MLNLKSGWKTTEFWLHTFVTVAGTLLATVPHITEMAGTAEAVIHAIGAIVALLASLNYCNQRVALKVAALSTTAIATIDAVVPPLAPLAPLAPSLASSSALAPVLAPVEVTTQPVVNQPVVNQPVVVQPTDGSDGSN